MKGKQMTEIPNKVKDAFATTATMMLASLGVPQNNIAGATTAFWNEVEGRGVASVTDTTPIDRSISRRQVADIIGRSRKTVSMMVANGILRGVYGGRDGKRLTGISESSLRAFMAGK